MLLLKQAKKINEDQTLVTLTNNKQKVFKCKFETFCKGVDLLEEGKVVQEAFPFLSADDREFMITGVENWDNLFPKIPQE